MPLKCIIIDDDQYAIDALVDYVDKMPELIVSATYKNALAALSAIKKEDQIDFIFLDIEMPEISGLELAKSLKDKTKFLIFTTSHTSHALTAFELNASQYLLKPITFSKFATTVDYILKDKQDHRTAQSANSKLRFIKADNKNAFHYVDSTEITHISAAKNYSIIYTAKEQYITYMGLSHMEASLDPVDFIRINKSTIIAKKAIRKIEGHTIILTNQKSFQLGDVYKHAFKAFLHESLL